MPDVPAVDEYPLTPVQQGMLFHWLQETNVGVDIEQMVGDLREDIDVAAMDAAWQRIADHHEILRTRFRWLDRDEPVQEVVAEVHVRLDVRDLGHLTPTEQQAELAAFLVEDRLRGFDLATAPLWRTTLLRLGPSRQRFVFTYHHSLLDTSVVWTVEEVFRTYDASAAARSPSSRSGDRTRTTCSGCTSISPPTDRPRRRTTRRCWTASTS